MKRFKVFDDKKNLYIIAVDDRTPDSMVIDMARNDYNAAIIFRQFDNAKDEVIFNRLKSGSEA